MSVARKHHYIPVHLLKKFIAHDSNHIHCYDNITQKTFTTHPNKICAERDFHGIKKNEYLVSYEDWVTTVEDEYREVVDNVIHNKSVKDLSDKEFFALSLMTAFQFVRTRGFREHYRDFVTKMHARATEIAKYNDAIFDEKLPDEDHLTITTFKAMQKSVPKYRKMLFKKHIFLIHAQRDCEFWLGDDPVVMYNENDYRPYGNIGFDVSGIQIYHPISSELTLAYWCPTVIGKVLRETNDASKNLVSLLMLAKNSDERARLEELRLGLLKEKSKVDTWANQIIQEMSFTSSESHMDFHNALQLENSIRHVLSQTGTYKNMNDMLNRFPNYSMKPTRIEFL